MREFSSMAVCSEATVNEYEKINCALFADFKSANFSPPLNSFKRKNAVVLIKLQNAN